MESINAAVIAARERSINLTIDIWSSSRWSRCAPLSNHVINVTLVHELMRGNVPYAFIDECARLAHIE